MPEHKAGCYNFFGNKYNINCNINRRYRTYNIYLDARQFIRY